MIGNKLQKIVEYLFYLLIFLLPWQTRLIIKKGEINGGYFEYGTYSLYLSDILLITILVLAGIYFFLKRKKTNKAKIKKFWYALAFWDFFSLLSIFQASNHYLAFYKYAWFLLGVGLFTLIIYFPYNKTKALFSFYLALFIQSLLAITQFLTQLSPANRWLGVSEHNPIDLGVSVVEGMGNLGFVERWLRAYGSLDHPNILGGFLAMGASVLIAGAISRSSNLSLKKQDDYRYKIFKINLWFYPSILFIVMGVFFSFSRASWLAMFVFCLAFILIAVISKNKLAQKYFLPILLYSGIVFFILSVPFGNLIEARFKGQGRLEYISKVERIHSLRQAKDVLKDHWLMGGGIGNYSLMMHDSYLPNEKPYYYQPTHNTFLLIWSELGILGLVSFLLFLILIFFEGVQKRFLIYQIPGFLALIILLFFDHWWWSLHFGVLYFWFILGIFFILFRVDNTRENMV